MHKCLGVTSHAAATTRSPRGKSSRAHTTARGATHDQGQRPVVLRQLAREVEGDKMTSVYEARRQTARHDTGTTPDHRDAYVFSCRFSRYRKQKGRGRVPS